MTNADASNGRPSEPNVEDKSMKAQKRELNELRSRYRFVDEDAKRRIEERKELKTRIDDLKAKIGKVPGDEHDEHVTESGG